MTNLGDGRIGMKCLSAGPYLFRFLGLLKMKTHYCFALRKCSIVLHKHFSSDKVKAVPVVN
jgi:hypothetical protein